MTTAQQGPVTLPAGLRIALLCSSLELGGAERQALLLAGHLRDQHQAVVTVFGMGKPGRLCALLEERRLPWQAVPRVESRLPQLSWLRIRQVALAMRQSRPELLVPYCMPANLLCGVALAMLGTRAAVWNQRDEGLARAAGFLERAALRRASGFIANSQGGADFLVSQGVAGALVCVIPNGVALSPALRERDSWRARLGVGPDTVVVCMLANLSPAKDHLTLVQAWSLVVRDLPAAVPVRLVLAGRQDAASPAIADAIAQARLAGSVVLTGQVDDVGGLLGAVDLGVLSSRSEGCSNAVLEYMASGLPVVATDIPALRSLLGDASGDCLAPVGDAQALARILVRFILDAGLRSHAGAGNARVAQERHAVPAMLERTTAHLAQVVASAGRA